MAVYTDITDAELEGFMTQFDLGQPLAFKGIAEGVSNSNFLLETDRGRFILTVYEARTKVDELPFFLELLRWIAGRGYPSATPIPDREGRLLKTVRGSGYGKPTWTAGSTACIASANCAPYWTNEAGVCGFGWVSFSHCP